MSASRSPEVEIFTDGACSGNPGPGGWGVLLRFGDSEKTLSGCEDKTTNNRMELMAAIKGLEALKRPCRVKLVTDSKYVQSGITQWLPRWKRRGWKTSNRQPVKKCRPVATAGHLCRSPRRGLGLGSWPQRPSGERTG